MKINRNLTIKQLLKKLPFEYKYINKDVVASLKNEGDKEVEIEFFKLDKWVSSSELTQEYKKRNLSPDFGAVISYVLDNPKILNEKGDIAIQNAENIYVTFSRRFDDERDVYCYRLNDGWGGIWWFGGVRKSGSGKSGDLASLVSEHLEIIKKEIKSIEELL